MDGYCVNTDGSYGCECKDGFDGDGYTCTNIDECNAPKEDGIKCDTNAKCTDLEPGFHCECNTGYDGSGFLGECRDLDECHLNTHSCDDESQGFADSGLTSIMNIVYEALIKSNMQEYRSIL